MPSLLEWLGSKLALALGAGCSRRGAPFGGCAALHQPLSILHLTLPVQPFRCCAVVRVSGIRPGFPAASHRRLAPLLGLQVPRSAAAGSCARPGDGTTGRPLWCAHQRQHCCVARVGVLVQLLI